MTTEKQHSKWGTTVEKLLRYVLGKRGELAVAATYICAVSTFIVAYTHPTRSVLVTVDQFSEADLEVFLILLSLPAAFRFLTESLLGDRRGHILAPKESDTWKWGGPAPPFTPPQAPPPWARLSLHRWGASFNDGGRLALAYTAFPGDVCHVPSDADEELPWVI